MIVLQNLLTNVGMFAPLAPALVCVWATLAGAARRKGERINGPE